MFGWCNLCGFLIVRISARLVGTRCLRCRSTQVHRAVGLALDELRVPYGAAVYELSSRGALHRYLSGKFADFTCSEYFDDVPPGEKRGNVTCQDVQNLLFPDRRFDLVTSTEVLEHIPDDRRGFREIFRVLKPGGHFVFTVPLGEYRETVERCRLESDGSLVHMLPPEYHGDRIRGKEAVLAFRNYGTDVIERLEECGFTATIQWYDRKRERIRRQNLVVARKPA
jgi:SAM-dependent methyltransferase